MRKHIAVLALVAGLGSAQIATGEGPEQAPAIPAPVVPEVNQPPACDKKCKHKRWHKRERRKLRRATSRNPIPGYIVACESGGSLHEPASDGLGGGRYQIIPSTWRANLPSGRFIHLAGEDHGPIWSSRLLQDKVAANIWAGAGSSAWVCA